MSIHYAIRTDRTLPLTRAESDEMRGQGYSARETHSQYEEVPQVVADMDEENGVYALFSDAGMKLSDWMPVKQSEEVQKEYILGRQKPGDVMHDSIGQAIQPGDYLYSHSHDHQKLELSQLVRTLRSKIVVEQLTDSHSWNKLRTRTPNSFIRIPAEIVKGEAVAPEVLTKRYSVREIVVRSEKFIFVDEATAQAEPQGHFGYFNSSDELLSGWILMRSHEHEAKQLNSKVHAQKKVVESLDTPLTDAMGTDILLGDFVFSNDNHSHNFMLCEVIGFTKDRVRLVGYDDRGRRRLLRDKQNFRGHRVITLNWPKNIVKFPINMTTV